jgi:DeoR/GlpR family transcriptional regulator of sugar metabolism
VVRHGELSLIGPRAQSAYTDLNCDTVFVGVAGISDVSGLSEYNLDDADVKRSALAAGRRIVVLADASKIGRVAFVTFAAIGAVDLLITNASPTNRAIRRIKDHDVEVLHVEPFEEEKE